MKSQVRRQESIIHYPVGKIEDSDRLTLSIETALDHMMMQWRLIICLPLLSQNMIVSSAKGDDKFSRVKNVDLPLKSQE